MRRTIAADTLRKTLTQYLTTTFGLADDDVRQGLERFLSHPEQGIFRGPYVRIRTPFGTADGDWRAGLDWTPDGFTPGCTRPARSPACPPATTPRGPGVPRRTVRWRSASRPTRWPPT